MANADEFQRMAKYPLVKSSDMPADLKEEVLDTCLAAAEKFPKDYEKCTQNIKELLDKRTGDTWHVVVGTNFAYDVTHKTLYPTGRLNQPIVQSKGLQYLYFGGTVGILVWKT